MSVDDGYGVARVPGNTGGGGAARVPGSDDGYGVAGVPGYSGEEERGPGLCPGPCDDGYCSTLTTPGPRARLLPVTL